MPRHLTARLAWHDSGWNGNVCVRPSDNSYCIGSRSLLSDRLRRHRDATREDAVAGKALEILQPSYEPPCYWGINAFGREQHPIVHRHAFEDLRSTHLIHDTLPPYSVFTWPFRISFNLDAETKARYGKYHPHLEDRINHFFAAHRPGHSVVFLYLNYDNPVSGDKQRYAVVGCGLLKEKGKPTRFEFTAEELRKYKAGPGMQHFPVVNWARLLVLDPDTVVRLPYHEYVQHVRRTPSDEAKLDEISVLIDEDALMPSFKFVCESMDDDQCLFLLHRLRAAAERVDAHGVVDRYSDDATERLDRLIAHVWRQRGTYPGLANGLAYLAMLGSQAEEPKVEQAEQLVDAVRATLPEGDDVITAIKQIVASEQAMPSGLRPFKGLLRHIRGAAGDDPAACEAVLRLSVFSLSAFQFERILSAGRASDDAPAFKSGAVSVNELLRNPYVLAERYVPILDDQKLRWKELEYPLRRDGPISVFHIDAGLFPDEEHVERADFFQLTPAGPERIRALALEHLYQQAAEHSDCFSSAERLYEAILKNPLFYRRKFTLRQEVLTSPHFIDHFRDRVVHSHHSGADYFYLREVKDAEELVERVIQRLVTRADHSADESWVAPWIADECSLLQSQVHDFDVPGFQSERQEALEALLRRSFIVLSGRPGAGKTHVVGKLVHHLLEANEPVTTLAPTGKAVLRLRTEARIGADTIDKFLFDAWINDRDVAGAEEITQRHLARIGDIRNLIIDESSMVDLTKIATLFRILEAQGLDKVRRVILVGDTNQLPPIGLGRPLEDIVW